MERVPDKLYYKIGEVCDICQIQPHVLRYWETEFSQLSPSKNQSGQRVYRYGELQMVRRIKQLLYDEGYTIAGANKKLATERFDSDAGPKPGAHAGSATRPAPERKLDTGSLPLFPASPNAAAVFNDQTRKLLETIRAELQSALEILR